MADKDYTKNKDFKDCMNQIDCSIEDIFIIHKLYYLTKMNEQAKAISLI